MHSKDVTLVRVTGEKLKVLRNLMSLYLHDLSEYSKELEVDEDGSFVYEGLEYYLEEEDLKPFFIYYNEELAGFILLNSGKYTALAVDYSVHEFFVLRSFRKKGIGKLAVKAVFKQFPGKYKIEQLIYNHSGIAFWKSLYSDVGIKYNEMIEKSDGEEYLVQIFDVK